MKKQKTADVTADQLKSEGDSVVNEPEKKNKDWNISNIYSNHVAQGQRSGTQILKSDFLNRKVHFDTICRCALTTTFPYLKQYPGFALPRKLLET